MDYITYLSDHTGTHPDKFFKSTLFRAATLLLGVNCLEPGQAQSPHDHPDQDKFYYVVEGEGRFRLGEEHLAARAGAVVWAPAGLIHGVTNNGDTRLTLLVGIAPAPTIAP